MKDDFIYATTSKEAEPVAIAKAMKFVDDDTYIFITTPEGKKVDVKKLTYHTAMNQLEIHCGGEL